MPNDRQYMYRCMQLARLGAYYTAPNPMVGAVLVRYSDSGEEEVIAEGWHQQFGGPHAEVNCIRQAEQRTKGNLDWSQCTLYVNLEPCSHYGKTPPCADLIISKGIKRVVIGMLDPNPLVSGKGRKKLIDAGIDVLIERIQGGYREDNKRFICLHEKHRPYVTLKWAQSADGLLDVLRDNAQNITSKPIVISNVLTKQLVHRMRAMNMAILVGSRTALLDNPKLNTTHWAGRNPIRILLDRSNIVPEDSNIFDSSAQTIVYSENTDWQYILHDLAERNIHSVLVEGGAQILNNILSDGTWDEIQVEISPEKLNTAGVVAPLIPLQDCYSNDIIGHKVYVIKNNR